MTFGEALDGLKRGERAFRGGWNGKDMWVVLIRAGTAHHRSSHGAFQMESCLGLKNAQGTMQPGWLASQADMLADDWRFCP